MKKQPRVTETRGRLALLKSLGARGWTQADLARALATDTGMDCGTGLVNRWFHGQRVPGRKWAGAIERVLGVRASLWDDAPLAKTG